MKTETKVILIVASILVIGGGVTAIVLINKSKKKQADKDKEKIATTPIATPTTPTTQTKDKFGWDDAFKVLDLGLQTYDKYKQSQVTTD